MPRKKLIFVQIYTPNMLKTFSIGGIHPPSNKLSVHQTIQSLPLPPVVHIFLDQHLGAPATALVEKGQTVKTGQLIAAASGNMSANIHASVSGTITQIAPVTDFAGIPRMAITISTAGDEWMEGIDLTPTLVEEIPTDKTEIVNKIRQAGIVGLGGATFPTHVKLSIPEGKKIDYLIINGVECEPFLTSDHQLMLEKAREILVGTRILGQALDHPQCFIGIENNKKDAIELLQKLAAAHAPEIKIVPLKMKYPQGGEKQLITAITGREVPSGGLPMDTGCVVQNVATAFAVYEAVQKNKPLIERIACVTGLNVATPCNLRFRIGTPLNELIQPAGGIPSSTGKIILGGPMMGKAVINTDAPAGKGLSGILFLDQTMAKRKTESDCIRCGKCISACPIGLEPYLLVRFARTKRMEDLEANHAQDCIECGCCLYSCPANIPLLDHIRLAKAAVIQRIRSRKS